ncbi:MAG: hypothetical protein RLZZ387_4547, partial [Chloroflexota bacterium]
MPQPPDPTHASPADTRLRRYLPADLLDALAADAEPGPRSRAAEAFVHLAAARYAISTYLPRLVLSQTLQRRAAPPWLLRSDASLLFADLSGSTALAERLSNLGREGTEIVTDFLNTIFAMMTDVVQAYGGDLLTFGSDALLVLFDGPAHTHTATAAALAGNVQLPAPLRRQIAEHAGRAPRPPQARQRAGEAGGLRPRTPG